MSQAKVDKYKEEKANRKEIMAKQKRNRLIAKICGGVVLLAIVAWIGTSIATSIYENRPVKTIYASLDAIEDYIADFSSRYEDETEESTEKEDSTEKEESTEATTEATK